MAGAASFLSLFFVRLRGMVNDLGGISVVDVRWRTRGHGEGDVHGADGIMEFGEGQILAPHR